MKKLISAPIHFYQKKISPHTPPSCRYHPTCSTYALQAIDKHGALKGGIMGVARILRCNPFIEGGVDEVPDYFTLRRNPNNVDDFYVPDFLVPADKEAQARFKELLEKYGEQLNVSEQLPSSVEILKQITDLKTLNASDFESRFTKEELSYLVDIEILPDLYSNDYQYFTIEKNQKNKSFLEVVEPYFEDTDLGTETPLIVLEKTGIWYTNLPYLGRDFMIQRGVTHEDIKNNSYHLWLVLNAMDEKENTK